MECMNIFSEKFHKLIRESVHIVNHSVLLESGDKEEPSRSTEDWCPEGENLTCSYCRVHFTDSQTHREHYKLDWHRYNLKQSLLSKLPISEEEFDEKTGNDDVSSISASDTEKEDTLDTYATTQGKIFLQNNNGQVFSMYRCVLFDKREEISNDELLGRLTECCVNNKQWTILMLGGGHFAGAIFKNNEPILHKTFHCYTVRASQGGSQSSKDGKSGGSQPKNAGASLRRYNEQALMQHVKSIVDTWRSEVEKSALIIYRASGPYNRSVLFGGSAPLLDRSDKRLRTIPFSTRRATFTELKRVHSLISMVEVYNSLEDASQHFLEQKTPEAVAKRSKVRSSCINRAKSREAMERPLPTALSSSSSSEDFSKVIDMNDDVELSFSIENINITEFDFGDPLMPKKIIKHSKTKKQKKSKSQKLKEREQARKQELMDVLTRGDLSKLKILLSNYLKCSEEGENKREHERKGFVNEVLDENSNTLLHISALNEHEEVVMFLLENDADPCLKNKNQHTAYSCTQSKPIRETLKQFARDNPEKYNYNKAQIPTNSLTDEEIAEKRRMQRKVKREKEKEKRKENLVKMKETDEKNRFLQLSDREKRALAAERRILSQSGTVTVRCFLCGSDIAGKVPFEYLGNRFCTIECLKAHRMQNPTVLS